MFSVQIRTTPVTKKEIDAYMLTNKGKPQEIIGYLRALIRGHIKVKKDIESKEAELGEIWAKKEKINDDRI